MNDQCKKFKGYDKEIMIFLYRDVGMLWEKNISKNEAYASTKKNEKLKQFFIKNKVIKYYVTNTDDMDQKEVKLDEIFFTNTASNVCSSLMRHLRNSIMHGEYEISKNRKFVYIRFRDINQKKKITMSGKIQLETLKKLISCFE